MKANIFKEDSVKIRISSLANLNQSHPTHYIQPIKKLPGGHQGQDVLLTDQGESYQQTLTFKSGSNFNS